MKYPQVMSHNDYTVKKTRKETKNKLLKVHKHLKKTTPKCDLNSTILANPETVVSSKDSADLIGCREDSLEPIHTTELFSPEPTSAYTTSQVSLSWHDHSAPAGSTPAYADVFKSPTTMSNFSPPRDTPASKSSAVPKTASLNLTLMFCIVELFHNIKKLAKSG